MPVSLDDARRLLTEERGLVVVTALRLDGSPSATVVNAGLLAHPGTGEEVAAFVIRADARKLARYRRRRWATVTARAGWQWVTIEGRVEVIGPDDPVDGVDPAELPGLLRSVYRAAGGTHDDWDTFDRVMAEERRTVIVVHPQRVYGTVSS